MEVIPHDELSRFQLFEHVLTESLHINQLNACHINADETIRVSEHAVEPGVVDHFNAHVVHQVVKGVIQPLVVGLHETPSVLIDQMSDIHHWNYIHQVLFDLHGAVVDRCLIVTGIVRVLGADIVLDEVVVRQPDTNLLPLVVPVLSIADYKQYHDKISTISKAIMMIDEYNNQG